MGVRIITMEEIADDFNNLNMLGFIVIASMKKVREKGKREEEINSKFLSFCIDEFSIVDRQMKIYRDTAAVYLFSDGLLFLFLCSFNSPHTPTVKCIQDL